MNTKKYCTNHWSNGISMYFKELTSLSSNHLFINRFLVGFLQGWTVVVMTSWASFLIRTITL